MSRDLSLDAARQVSPRALASYAHGLGWVEVPNGKRPGVAVFHRPDSRLHQVIVPTDLTWADYDEVVAEAVRKFADFERRPATEVLEHLLLPPADLLRFREVSPDAEAGSLPFDHAAQMIGGLRRLLLSAAHSVLAPRPSHARLSRAEAEEFVGRCRLGQTERGSFVLNVACPLGPQLSLPGAEAEPFGRRVTSLLIHTLGSLASAAETSRTEDLLDLKRTPGMSANFCESVLQLRPNGERATLTVSAAWSRAALPPGRPPTQPVELRQEVFDIVQELAPRLRTRAAPRPARFVGFVDALRGQPTGDDPRPSGEVDFSLLDDEQGVIRARALLGADLYAIAGQAHLGSDPVAVRAVLRPHPRVSKLDDIQGFERLDSGIPQPAS
ncbi:MAG: hypothetical protein ACRC33_18250 [Gemmataceae bacterium]